MGQGSVGRIALCVIILTAGSARAARPPQIKSLDDDSAVQLSVLMQEEPSAANDCGMLPNVDKDCTPCEGDTPYTDLVTQECVAECTVGHEIKGGDEPDKGQCVACQAGKFADHVKHTCGSACPEGTTENDDARNCDSHVTLYKDTDVTLSEEGSTSDSSEEERKKKKMKKKKKGGSASGGPKCPPDKPWIEWRHKSDQTSPCVSKCPVGQVPRNKITHWKHRKCRGCAKGKFADQVGHQCVTDCPSGTAGTPVPPVGRRRRKKHSYADCELCPEGTYTDSVAHKCVTNCPRGKGSVVDAFDQTNHYCVDCLGDTPYVDFAGHKCVAACPPGEFGNAYQSCVLCDIPFALKPYTDLTARECVAECASGEEIKGGNSTDRRHCQACETGKFADHVNHACATECPTGTAQNSATLNCDPPPPPTPAPTPPPPPLTRRQRKKKIREEKRKKRRLEKSGYLVRARRKPREASWRRLWRKKEKKGENPSQAKK